MKHGHHNLGPGSRLGIFISYASEDGELASGIARVLRDALGFFAEINVDRWFMELGKEFRPQLQKKLAASDILIILYTGKNKSYTGWEIGFFEALKAKSIDNSSSEEEKRIIPLYFEKCPEAVSGYEGFDLSIPRDLLRLSYEEFSAKDDVPSDCPLCKLVRNLQKTVDKYQERFDPDGTYPDKENPKDVVKKIRLAVFRYIKTTVSEVLKPGKQITIKVSGALDEEVAELPLDAKLVPAKTGAGAMEVFGLEERDMTWAEFLASVPGTYKHAWSDAITSVVTSSLYSLNVDNSEVVVADQFEGRDRDTYRLVLPVVTKYFDNSREFTLYLMQAATPEYGNENVTMMLKALQMACRFRRMFLERGAKFRCANVGLASPERIQEMARALRDELNDIERETANAGLDQPGVWMQYVGEDLLIQMAQAYREASDNVRKLIARSCRPTRRRDTATAAGDLPAAESTRRGHRADQHCPNQGDVAGAARDVGVRITRPRVSLKSAPFRRLSRLLSEWRLRLTSGGRRQQACAAFCAAAS